MSAALEVGTAVTPLRHTPTNVQLFRYSAATWNAHRIHYDQEYAAFEGHPGILVHSHLHAALMLRMVSEHFGHEWAITNVAYRMRHSSVPGTELVQSGRVVESSDDRVVVEVSEHDEAGNLCLEGTVTVERRT